MSFDEIRGCGFSSRKVEYVKSLATHFIEHKITKANLEKMTDSQVRETLIKVKGIGDWSLHMLYELPVAFLNLILNV